MRLIALATLGLTALSAPAFADETTGTILAYDRLANIIVLQDKIILDAGCQNPCPV